MEFEIARHFVGKQTINVEGTREKVGDSAKFEIAHVRDSKSRLYVHVLSVDYNIVDSNDIWILINI